MPSFSPKQSIFDLRGTGRQERKKRGIHMKKRKLLSSLLSAMILIGIAAPSVVHAAVSDGYTVYQSSDMTNPATTSSTLSDAINYVNNHASADSWVIKVTADDPSVGAASVLNASGATVTLTSDSGAHTLFATTVGIRHIEIAAGNLVLENITLDGTGIGGGISMTGSANLVMNANATIQNAKASRGGGIQCTGTGSITMNSGSKVSACQSTYYGTGGSGAGIYSNGSVTLNDGSLITGNTANKGKGGGICIDFGSLVMNGGEISKNTVTGVGTDFQGGGVCIYSNGANFKMYGGKITENKADIGAGVSLWYTGASSTFTMYGGEISQNDTTFVSGLSNYHGFGGGVFAWGWADQSIDIQGGSIHDNVAKQGGGIMVYTTDSRVRIAGSAELYGNKATWGGAVFNEGSGSTVIGNANIHDNTASYGGGIYVYKGNLTVKDKASISNNSASYGAGVYSYSVFAMEGQSVIANNKSEANGAGIYARSTFTMSGDATIQGNEAGGEGGGVVLSSATARFTMNGGTITANKAKTFGGGITLSGAGPVFTMDAAGAPKIYGNIADVGADDVYNNGGTANLISVAQMNLPAGVHAANWFYDQDAARYRDPAAVKTVYADSLLTGIASQVKLTVGLYYEVAFDSKGGSAVGTITPVLPNATIVSPTDPTKTGSTFDGWYKDRDCTVLWDFTKDAVTGDMTLYANWIINKYDITFHAQGGSAVAGIDDVDYGTAVTRPSDPTKTGNTFGGWFTDATCTTPWDFSDPVKGDLELFAKWTAIPCTLTFNTLGGTAVSPETVDYGTAATRPTDPTKTGNTFGGWYTDTACTTPWNFSDSVTSNLELYAKWTAKSYQLTFDSTGGSAVYPEPVLLGDSAARPTDPTKPGSTFGGWYADADCTILWDFSKDVISGDMTLYAKWIVSSTGTLSATRATKTGEVNASTQYLLAVGTFLLGCGIAGGVMIRRKARVRDCNRKG